MLKRIFDGDRSSLIIEVIHFVTDIVQNTRSMADDKLEMLKTRVSSQVACTCDTDRLPCTKTGPQQLFCSQS